MRRTLSLFQDLDKNIQKSITQAPEVNLLAPLNKEGMTPDDIVAYAAAGDFEEKSASELYQEDLTNLSRTEMLIKEKVVIDESAGRGHGSVLDQIMFTFCIKDLTREATLMLCGPEYMAHEQQSLRRAKADRGFYLPPKIRQGPAGKAYDVLSKSFELYEKMNEDDKPKEAKTGIPGEDARYILPLFTKTNITTSVDARELMHFLYLSEQMPTAIKVVSMQMGLKAREVAPITMEYRPGANELLAWWPSPMLFARENKTMDEIILGAGNPLNTKFTTHEITEEMLERAVKQKQEAELANLKHSHNGSDLEGFLAPMSLAAFHQMTRQRTLNQSVESIYSAYKRKQIVIPPSIAKSKFKKEYIQQNKAMFELVDYLVHSQVPITEAIGCIPHSLMVYDMLHVNGVNAYIFGGERNCIKAQWEIRGISVDIKNGTRQRKPVLADIFMPRGVLQGKCHEKKPCKIQCPEFKGTDPSIFYKLK